MEKYIYMITNLINQKKYIGQSKDAEKRFNQHSLTKEKYTSLINRAMNKYGKENFDLEILYHGENYNEKEKEYIQLYNTLVPNGYNIAEGGEDPPTRYGEDNNYCKIPDSVIKQI